MRAALIAVLLVVATAAAAGSKYVAVRHRLAAQRESMNTQWSEVETALDRQAALIPDLAAVVKRYAKPAPQLFQDVARAHQQFQGAHAPQEKIEATDQLSAGVARLLVLSENYPRLRANKNYLRLLGEISDTENDIAVARREYNETLEHYNAELQRFPDNTVAWIAGFTRNDAYFKTEPGARAAPNQ